MPSISTRCSRRSPGGPSPRSSSPTPFAVPETKALFTGEHVMGWSTTIVSPPDGDMAAYVDSLTKLQSRDDRIYYHAHGDQETRPHRQVRGLIGHRKQREGQILRLLAAEPRTIPAMVAKMYVGIDPRLFPAGARSVLEHLIELQARGVDAENAETWRLTS